MLDKIYNIDCLQGMKDIPDRSIDLVLCDPPYGTTKNKWDKIIDFDDMWKQLLRITKESSAICMFAQTPFDKQLAMSKFDLYRYEWIYEKKHATGFLNANKMPLKAHEKILVFYKKLPIFNPQKTFGTRKVVTAAHKSKCQMSTHYGKHMKYKDYDSTERFPRDVITFSFRPDENIVHPSQKPKSSGVYFIETYTNKGDTVLDFASGSGTNAEAAIETGRHYICFEKEKTFYDYSVKRTEQAKQKMRLF